MSGTEQQAEQQGQNREQKPSSDCPELVTDSVVHNNLLQGHDTAHLKSKVYRTELVYEPWL
ncbi:MAG: hypothetical protein KME12_24890 [Trichocoleus desertorum ATA4-8-CV12]|nr:hypothetical protein [Trichocoleus desertorum ATA4-8-CV12]